VDWILREHRCWVVGAREESGGWADGHGGWDSGRRCSAGVLKPRVCCRTQVPCPQIKRRSACWVVYLGEHLEDLHVNSMLNGEVGMREGGDHDPNGLRPPASLEHILVVITHGPRVLHDHADDAAGRANKGDRLMLRQIRHTFHEHRNTYAHHLHELDHRTVGACPRFGGRKMLEISHVRQAAVCARRRGSVGENCGCRRRPVYASSKGLQDLFRRLAPAAAQRSCPRPGPARIRPGSRSRRASTVRVRRTSRPRPSTSTNGIKARVF